MFDFAGFGNIILGIDVVFLHKNGGADLGFRIRSCLTLNTRNDLLTRK